MDARAKADCDITEVLKSREVQRGLLAEMRGDQASAAHHFLAAAHLELVLANDYAAANEIDLARRSRLSAASCFWRGGQQERARILFAELREEFPNETAQIENVLRDLEAA